MSYPVRLKYRSEFFWRNLRVASSREKWHCVQYY